MFMVNKLLDISRPYHVVDHKPLVEVKISSIYNTKK
jgi:hypothetical protein